MAGKKHAVISGGELEKKVSELVVGLGLDVSSQVAVARRIWGAKRKIDLVVKDKTTKKILGIECKAQNTAGTAEEKIQATVEDMKSWPIAGLIVFEGSGFSENMQHYLVSTGKAVEFDELEEWLRLFFAL